MGRLEDQLDLRARHPDFQRFLDINERESQRVARGYECVLDQPYGNDELQRLDVFPSEQPASPLVVFIHGGYWRALDKRSYRFVAEPFVQRGYSVFVINYRLMPAVTMPELVGDIREALRWIQRHATRYAADPARMTIAGHSAGGHLALQTYLDDADLRPSIRCLCSLSGIFDLEPIRASYLDDVLRLSCADVDAYSPARRDLSIVQCPTLLAVGAAETELFVEQSKRLFADNRANPVFEYHECDGLNHYEVAHELGRPESAVARFILEHGQ